MVGACYMRCCRHGWACFAATERYGLIIVLLLAFTGVLWIVLNPLMQYSLMAITPLLTPYMLG